MKHFGIPKLGRSKFNKLMHYTVAAIIKKNNKYLLINRRFYPLGFAGVGGHIDKGENPITALKREVKEESGFEVIKSKLIFEEEIDKNRCIMGIKTHYWYLFNCEVKGKLKRNKLEEKSIGWYSVEEIKKLELEPVWEYLFKKLKMIC
jgi:ADP-ribose pyrophosphatase YjhB (NUDIX family)